MQLPSVRFAFLADAIATAATGLLMAAAGQLLAEITGIPAGFSVPVGIALVAFAALVGIVGTRRQTPRSLATAIVGINALWVVGSLAVLALGAFPLTMLGVAFVVIQALAVAALAILQHVSLGSGVARAA
jgi:hypothetical protein